MQTTHPLQKDVVVERSKTQIILLRLKESVFRWIGNLPLPLKIKSGSRSYSNVNTWLSYANISYKVGKSITVTVSSIWPGSLLEVTLGDSAARKSTQQTTSLTHSPAAAMKTDECAVVVEVGDEHSAAEGVGRGSRSYLKRPYCHIWRVPLKCANVVAFLAALTPLLLRN